MGFIERTNFDFFLERPRRPPSLASTLWPRVASPELIEIWV